MCNKKNANGIPPPKAIYCLDKLNIQENINDILLIANINKKKPKLSLKQSGTVNPIPSSSDNSLDAI